MFEQQRKSSLAMVTIFSCYERFDLINFDGCCLIATSARFILFWKISTSRSLWLDSLLWPIFFFTFCISTFHNAELIVYTFLHVKSLSTVPPKRCNESFAKKLNWCSVFPNIISWSVLDLRLSIHLKWDTPFQRYRNRIGGLRGGHRLHTYLIVQFWFVGRISHLQKNEITLSKNLKMRYLLSPATAYCHVNNLQEANNFCWHHRP